MRTSGRVKRSSRGSGKRRISTLATESRSGVPSSESLSAKAKDVNSESRARIRDLETLVTRQQAQIERLQKPKFRQPKLVKSGRSGYTRLIVPDTHGAKCDVPAMKAFLSDVACIRDVREVVLLGDHLDCGGFLAEHHVLNYIEESAYSYVDDVEAANVFLDAIQKLCPKAKIYYIEGNHESRVESWCMTRFRSLDDMRWALRCFAPENVLSLERRGITFIKRKDRVGSMTSRGCIQLGKCVFTHGHRTGANAAAAHLRDYKTNVVYGHTHRVQAFSEASAFDEQLSAWSPGFLAMIRPYWMHTAVTHWGHGYAVQLVQNDDRFLHINVRIIEGKSLLRNLI